MPPDRGGAHEPVRAAGGARATRATAQQPHGGEMTDGRHGAGPPIDWVAIERLPEFQELVTGRRRFAWIAGGLGIGFGALYVVLAATAHDLMRTSLRGSFSLGFAWGVALILVTW